MTYALIGCGRIAPNHISAAIENKLEIVALCDIVIENAAKLAAKFSLSKAVNSYMDYIEMLDKEKPTLVAIATESGKHAKIALDCIAAGCHVIIEKPIALSLADADAIIETGEKAGVVVCACHQNRFNKSIQKIRHSLEAGRFGRLLHGAAHVRWNRKQDYYTQAPWRGTWAQDGGALMNQCIHNIDILRWMMGDDVVEVMGMTDRMCHNYIEAEDFGIATVRFMNGAYGIIEGTTNVFPRNLEETLYIFGEKGTVKAGGKSINLIEEWHFADNVDDPGEVKKMFSESPSDVYGFGHTLLYADMINAVNNSGAVYIDAHAGKRALELVLAIYKSAAEGVSVKLPLKDCSTLDFAGRF